MYKRSMPLIISGVLACFLISLVGSIALKTPSRAFALMYNATPTVTPSPVSSTPCITIGNSIPSCSPFFTADKPSVPYKLQQGTLIQIAGTGWVANAAVELYILPARDVTSGLSNNGLCPSQPLLIASNVAHSAKTMTGASGSFSSQLTLPATLTIDGLYAMCISVSSPGHVTSTLLFQIKAAANPQLRPGNATTTGAPFSFNLSIIALILALIALLLYVLSPRQPAASHLTSRRNAS